MVPVWVRQHRPKVHELEVPYPMIGLKQWASYLLATSPRFLLGGFSTSETDSYTLFIHNFGLAIRSWILNILSMNIIPQPSGGDAFLLPFTGMKEGEKERSQYSSHRTK